MRPFPARTVPEVDTVFASMLNWRPDAAMRLCGQQAALELHTMSLARKHRLPVMPYRVDEVSAGGLIAYATNNADLFRLAATYVDRILKGAKPAGLPVQQPTKFDFVINLLRHQSPDGEGTRPRHPAIVTASG